MSGAATIELTSEEFARRLARLLVATRTHRRLSVRDLVRSGHGRYTKELLAAVEAGAMCVDDQLLEELGTLYGADLGLVLPVRSPVRVSDDGLLTAGSLSMRFTPGDEESMLTTYLELIRALRRQRSSPAIDLRRDDIEALATALHRTGTHVVERLADLMGGTKAQRAAMSSRFEGGATVVGIDPSLEEQGAPTGEPVLDLRDGAFRVVHTADPLAQW